MKGRVWGWRGDGEEGWCWGVWWGRAREKTPRSFSSILVATIANGANGTFPSLVGVKKGRDALDILRDTIVTKRYVNGI